MATKMSYYLRKQTASFIRMTSTHPHLVAIALATLAAAALALTTVGLSAVARRMASSRDRVEVRRTTTASAATTEAEEESLSEDILADLGKKSGLGVDFSIPNEFCRSVQDQGGETRFKK